MSRADWAFCVSVSVLAARPVTACANCSYDIDTSYVVQSLELRDHDYARPLLTGCVVRDEAIGC
ncbi:hypothetical protein D3C71_1481130 [compost metagenome]